MGVGIVGSMSLAVSDVVRPTVPTANCSAFEFYKLNNMFILTVVQIHPQLINFWTFGRNVGTSILGIMPYVLVCDHIVRRRCIYKYCILILVKR